MKENGNFWLSNTPEVPASVSWENVFPIPRMVTWGKFELRGPRKSFYVFNTHFSATSVLARVKSAELLHQRASEVCSEYPVFMIGDFNAPGGSQVWEILTGDVFEDAWEVSDSKSGPEFTSHDFKGPDAEGKERIDWILSNSSKVRRVETVTFNENGKYPSDHFPVYAEIELPSFEVKKEIPFTLLIGGIITAAVMIIVVMYGRYRLV